MTDSKRDRDYSEAIAATNEYVQSLIRDLEDTTAGDVLYWRSLKGDEKALRLLLEEARTAAAVEAVQ